MRAVLFCSLPPPPYPRVRANFYRTGLLWLPCGCTTAKNSMQPGGWGGVLVRECHASSLAEDGFIVCQQGKKARTINS